MAYVVCLENYGKRSGIKAVDYARRDVEAFADVLEAVFPGKTVELEPRFDEEATLSVLKYEVPQTMKVISKGPPRAAGFIGTALSASVAYDESDGCPCRKFNRAGS